MNKIKELLDNSKLTEIEHPDKSAYWHLLKLRKEMQQALDLACVMPALLDIDFLELRKQKGLTLRQVQDETGISNAYLSQLETGKIKSPGYNTVKALYELYSNGA